MPLAGLSESTRPLVHLAQSRLVVSVGFPIRAAKHRSSGPRTHREATFLGIGCEAEVVPVLALGVQGCVHAELLFVRVPFELPPTLTNRRTLVNPRIERRNGATRRLHRHLSTL